MPRDVLTIEEDGSDSAPEFSGSSTDEIGPEKNEEVVQGATVNFMNEPTGKKKRKEKVRRKILTKREERTKRKKAVERIAMGLVKPDITTDKEKERMLRKIATKGVVQLFNAVAERQRTMSKELAKKLNSKERKEAEERLRGSRFDVHAQKQAKEEMNDELDEVKKECSSDDDE